MINRTRKIFTFFFLAQLVIFPAEAKAPDSLPTLLNVDSDGNTVTLDLSQLMPYDVTTLSSPARLVIEIQGTLYKTGFAKKTINGDLIRRIRGYQFRENPLIARVVVDLSDPVDYTASADDNKVTIALKRNPLAGKTEDKPVVPKKEPIVRKKDLLSSLPKEKVTLDFEGADIRDVIRLMAETSNINIIFGPEVAGNIAIHLKDVPFDEAFSTILNLKGLVASQLGGNILRVTTPELLLKERQKAIVYTKTVPVNYLKADEMQRHLSAVMASAGRKGIITVVAETNSLVITDSEEGIGQSERLIAQLDKRPRQVMIEARIVEINLNNGFDIGVQWEYWSVNNSRNPDGTFKKVTEIGNWSSGAPVPHTNTGGAFSGFPVDEDFGPNGPSRGTGVQLPGPAQTAISFGILKNDMLLTSSLQALVTQSKAKILSAPKVVTINGASAKIEAVQDIRFQTSTVSNGVVSTNFTNVKAGIVLSVTPTINAEDSITLNIAPESSFPTQESTDAGPIIRTRTAQTTVIIRDGETLVIGGLIDDQDTKGVSKVPILGDIPIIGVFFRSNTTRKIRNELLVFVTPRIVRD